MPIVKHVLIFSDNTGYGWSEVHWRGGGATPNLKNEMLVLLGTIAPLRSALLGQDQAIIGGRVSYKRSKAVASLSEDTFKPGLTTQASAAENLSLAVQFVDSNSTRRKITHLRGFWDVVESNGQYFPAGGAADNWELKMGAWKQALIDNQYGWPGKNTTDSETGRVTNYVIEADGRVLLTLADEPLPAAVVGKPISIRFSRINRSSSPLNRALVVDVISPTSVRTVLQVGVGPFATPGRYNYRATEFIAYSEMQKVKLGRRAPGRPIGRLPGRSRAKPLY